MSAAQLRVTVRGSGTGAGSEPTELVLGVHGGSRIGRVAETLAESTSGFSSLEAPLLSVEGRLLPAELPLRGAGIVDGTALVLGGTEPWNDVPVRRVVGARRSVAELRVVGGPDAGGAWLLGPGTYTVGPDAGHVIQVTEAEEPFTLTITPDGRGWIAASSGRSRRSGTPPVVPIAVLAPEGDVRRDAAGAEPEIPWPVGADLPIGRQLLRLTEAAQADAAVSASGDGFAVDFNRPPRLVPPLALTRLRMPVLPVRPGRRPFPMVMMVAPVLMGVGMAYFFKNTFYLVFTAFSPVFAVANWWSDRRTGRRTYRRDMKEYRAKRERITAQALDAVRDEHEIRRTMSPDPAAVAAAALGPGGRLWERRRAHPDYLALRVGTVEQPSIVEVEDIAREDGQRSVRWPVPNSPLGLDLPRLGVVGLCGDEDAAQGLARWLVAQCSVLHSPRDLRLMLLTDSAAAVRWDWLRWLPHARPSAPGGPAVCVGNDPETVANRVSELVSLIKARSRAKGSALSAAVATNADIIVIADGARRLREVPGMVQVLTEGPAARVFVVCVDRAERLLPEECAAVVECAADRLAVRQKDTPEVADVCPDLVEPDWCEAVARAIAPIRDVTVEDDSGLPDSVPLLGLLGCEPPDAAALAARWKAEPASTRALLGAGYDGPAAFDLVRDGPHALIGGTTGSGKSELLQSLVASLAVANRPDELVFVLVDYKGGSAFRDCVRLPHTLGMVTDLDEHLVTRALDSLRAELRRRERVLADASAKDLPQYRSMRARDPELPPLPRLLLVIDEFATLVREVPEFVPGLVGIAQRGRSLGLHLVLATQRPAGAVNHDIKANTNLRIALRVTDATESHDVIDATDAVTISAGTPGRALARIAHGTVVAFQTGYAGAVRGRAEAEADQDANDDAVWALPLPWTSLGRRLDAPLVETARAVVPEDEETDLSALVDAIRDATESLGIEAQPSPWLPPLPAVLTLDDLASFPTAPARTDPTGAVLPPVAFAVEDLPAQQLQRAITLDFSTFHHLYILGAPRSGRSQVLRTLAGAIARKHSCADVHLYAIDAAGGALNALEELPHTGAVARRGDLDRIDRLVTRIGAELTRRQELLSDQGAATLTELRTMLAPADRPAHLMFFIDGWESLFTTTNDHDNGRLTEDLVRIVREGAASGIHVVATSERALLSGRIATLNDNKLMLRMADRSDYTMIGIDFGNLPTVLFPGRGWRSEGPSETQIALLGPGLSGQEQASALKAIGEHAAKRDAAVPDSRRPFKVGTVPGAVTFADAYAQVPTAARRPLWALIGVGGDESQPIGADFATRTTFTVAGPGGSGRSTALLSIAVSLLAHGTAVLAVTPRTSPLAGLARHERAAVIASANPAPGDLEDALRRLGGPAVVLVDDVDMIPLSCAADAFLTTIVRTGKETGRGIAVAGSADHLNQVSMGWLGEVRRGRRGLLLAPQGIMEGDLAGVRLPVSLTRRPIKPGVALTADPSGSGSPVAIAVPLTVMRAG
ncbi:cell division protein FtsK [Actinospica sp. MGRD01-02]|uniref:Cell division protein FtsK n=1 Tax=Actinospica acidithermotolerans TaxID=2828514 RepID=A0A941E5Y7_9ACTN|nr:FtsK/SpoIIIE domain-containing protein [Actinospica acidithermotolerans]MBR7826955.1 cell division protein FtsK [Actinospica acidithermotolerans]